MLVAHHQVHRAEGVQVQPTGDGELALAGPRHAQQPQLRAAVTIGDERDRSPIG